MVVLWMCVFGQHRLQEMGSSAGDLPNLVQCVHSVSYVPIVYPAKDEHEGITASIGPK